MIDALGSSHHSDLSEAAAFDTALQQQNLPAYIRHPVQWVKSEFRHQQLKELVTRIEVTYPDFNPTSAVRNQQEVKTFLHFQGAGGSFLLERLNGIKGDLGGIVHPRLLSKDIRHRIRDLGYTEQSIHNYYQQAERAAKKAA